MDRVLTGSRPTLEASDAVAVAAELFGVEAQTAHDLGSERDRTFALEDGDGARTAIIKISNAHEDPDVLDMEAAAALHVATVDPELVVALPWRPLSGGGSGPAQIGDEPASLRATWTPDETPDEPHWVRLYSLLAGRSHVDTLTLSDQALIEWGATTARLGRALRGFAHPKAHRVMLWDIQHALRCRSMLDDIRDAHARRLVARTLDDFERHATPIWPSLRAQVLHTDITPDNVLVDDDGFISGIIDFGDMSHTALVADIGSVLCALVPGRSSEERLRLARLVLDGYEREVPLEDRDRQVAALAWAARSAVTLAISSWRVAQGLEEAAFAERANDECVRDLELFEELGLDTVNRKVGGITDSIEPDPSLQGRRDAAFGPAMDPLFYDQPIEVASASGVWITTADGRRYLDGYNNVPCVGHGHPRVTAAIARQSRTINTHARYLHPSAIALAERLSATCPPGLDTVLLVNSGSEANDWAWRLAVAATGNRGGLCTATAYHGVTEATAALSPEVWLDGVKPAHIETFAVCDTYRRQNLDGAAIQAAIEQMTATRLAPAATILDGLVMSDGVADLDQGYVQELVRLTRGAGGMWIADEVQSGHGRTGAAMWAFERFGIVPDFVTLGKPMGNGHPVAAVITRREIVAEIADETTLFSTFGGNPVSAAAALAVLDVMEDERILARVEQTGRLLGAELAAVAARHPSIGDVRGVGLAWGVELVSDPETREPDAPRARQVREAMKSAGVLVGTTGPHGNVLKVRPPLALRPEHVPILAGALDAALS
ncbi:MAG TPA: aminotransferase class III-fold pyridoxal phosphate-dependent enzyme [Solirubrobacteraceae bacterium]|nr:aminotransferase class III-fold pyridoxal phosphate-dependent enzyme [Solirubrobacteraceae bacterium]